MLVSTKVLAVMEFAPVYRRSPTQVISALQAFQGALSGSVESQIDIQHLPQLFRDQSAQRCAPPGGQHFGFMGEFLVHPNRNVRVHDAVLRKPRAALYSGQSMSTIFVQLIGGIFLLDLLAAGDTVRAVSLNSISLKTGSRPGSIFARS